jgi:hypothetical protein
MRGSLLVQQGINDSTIAAWVSAQSQASENTPLIPIPQLLDL